MGFRVLGVTTYLGSLLTDTVHNTAEVNSQIAMAIKTARQLKIFWDKARTTTAWKLQVFNAIIQSRVTHGLEFIQLAQAELTKLEAFQMKNLRRILKIAPTHIDRTQTNQKVWDKVAQYEVHMQRISVTWKEATLKLLGHILSASRYDSLRQDIFETGTNAPTIIHCKPVGRPRADWVRDFKRCSVCP